MRQAFLILGDEVYGGVWRFTGRGMATSLLGRYASVYDTQAGRACINEDSWRLHKLAVGLERSDILRKAFNVVAD